MLAPRRSRLAGPLPFCNIRTPGINVQNFLLPFPSLSKRMRKRKDRHESQLTTRLSTAAQASDSRSPPAHLESHFLCSCRVGDSFLVEKIERFFQGRERRRQKRTSPRNPCRVASACAVGRGHRFCGPVFGRAEEATTWGRAPWSAHRAGRRSLTCGTCEAVRRTTVGCAGLGDEHNRWAAEWKTRPPIVSCKPEELSAEGGRNPRPQAGRRAPLPDLQRNH